jgi:hypothetical protein
MSFAKGSKNTQTQQNQSGTSTTALNPALNSALYGNLASTQSLASGYQPYTGQLVAPTTAATTQAQQGLIDFAQSGVGTPALNSAVSAAGGVAGYTPQQITAGQIANTDLTPYENPYTSDVINTTNSDLARANDILNTNTNASATAAGAFGGDRSAVANNLNNESYLRTLASTDAGLNSANFTQAQTAASQDIASRLSAAQGNQTAAATGAGLNLQGASLLGTLSGQQVSQGAGLLGLIDSVGQQQQAQQQSVDTANAGQFQTNLSNEEQLQQLINQALGLVPQTGTTTSSGTASGTSNEQDTSTGGSLLDLTKAAGNIASVVALSDGRLKRDIITLGHDAKGRRWIEYSYCFDNPGVRRRGVIAQEVAKTDPDAVQRHESGWLMVDYAKLKEAA